MKKLLRADISKKQLLLFSAAVMALRLCMTALQRVSLAPEISMLDDMLMYDGAVSITSGLWLGPYSYMTIGKHMLFSVWLALVHWTGISYVLAGNILSVFACAVMAAALSPIIKNRLHRLALLAALIFCPALYASHTLRVYRDNITTSFFILVFACVAALALRWNSPRTGSFWAYAVSGGLSLGISYLLREDGYWLLPFFVVGCGVMVFCVLKNGVEKRAQKVGAVVSMFAAAALCIAAYCGMNYKYYGRFIISDFTSGDFAAAYGALTRIDSDSGNLLVPVDKEARALMYEASPAFAELKPYLEDETALDWWRKDTGEGVYEYSGGGFYWAVRNAASLAGYYEDAHTAEAYYLRLADELNRAYDEGRLPAAAGKRSALNTPITARYIWPTLKEAGISTARVAVYSGIDCSPDLSVGSRRLITEVAGYLNCGAMVTTTYPAEGARIEVWAVSANRPVSISVKPLGGGEAGAAPPTEITTGGDVYSLMLREGITPLYHKCRSTFSLPGEAADYVITLDDGETTIEVAPLEMADYALENGIYYRVEYAGGNYSEQVEHGAAELWLYRGMRVVTAAYSVMSPVMALSALFCLGRALARRIKNGRRAGNGIAGAALAGIFLSMLLRVGMVAFAEVSAFGIGTNPMYLAIVYPMGIVCCFMCFFLYLDSPLI